jgi:hypothetical protein
MALHRHHQPSRVGDEDNQRLGAFPVRAQLLYGFADLVADRREFLAPVTDHNPAAPTEGVFDRGAPEAFDLDDGRCLASVDPVVGAAGCVAAP